MMPIGPLMAEHRVIEKLIKIINEELTRIKKTDHVEPSFIQTVVDFFRTYADRTHHGKEEDILFRDLAKKSIAQAHKKMMEQLMEEHTYARKTVTRLEDANKNYMHGNSQAIKAIIQLLFELANFYPVHIQKEDEQFFFPCMEYFNEQEQDRMLQEFWTFDRKMIHEKYRKVIRNLQKDRN